MDEMLFLAEAITRFGLAVVLLVAGVTKLVAPAQSAKSIEHFALVPKRYTYMLGWLLPIAEVSVAVGLLLPRTVIAASLGAALLFVLFTTASAIVLVEGRSVDCGCFGTGRQTRVSKLTVLRAAFFFVAAILLFINNIVAAKFVPLLPSELALIISVSSLLCMTAGIMVTLWIRRTAETSQSSVEVTQHIERSISRRAVLKLTTLVGLASLLSVREAGATPCCKCVSYQHYDKNCCVPGSYFYRHHHYVYCYNYCSGQLGALHRSSPDTCDTCDCGRDPCDSRTTLDQCCYASECGCCFQCPC